jgi:hypothetical protein
MFTNATRVLPDGSEVRCQFNCDKVLWVEVTKGQTIIYFGVGEPTLNVKEGLETLKLG